MAVGTLVAFAWGAGLAEAESRMFTYTGAEQTFTVPSGVSSIHVTAVGGHGGNSLTCDANCSVGLGGIPGVVIADLDVVPGQVLFVEVGGNGENGGSSSLGRGGFNGGGSTLYPELQGAGGGASDVRTLSRTSPGSLLTRLIVAGGGGGGAGGFGGGATEAADGGFAGQNGDSGLHEQSCTAGGGGQGATAALGGLGGAGASQPGSPSSPSGGGGTLGLGGQGAADSGSQFGGGGGGGGGYYGGGGGGAGGFFTNPSCAATGGAGGGGSNLSPDGGEGGTTGQPGVEITFEPGQTPPAGQGPPSGVQTPPASQTGQRAAALKKCKKKKSRAARKKCRKRARRLPV